MMSNNLIRTISAMLAAVVTLSACAPAVGQNEAPGAQSCQCETAAL